MISVARAAPTSLSAPPASTTVSRSFVCRLWESSQLPIFSSQLPFRLALRLIESSGVIGRPDQQELETMADSIVFVQIQGDGRVTEVVIPEKISATALRGRLREVGVLNTDDFLVFVDEAEEQVREGATPLPDIRHGTRVHITRCHKIHVSVNYVNKTIEREFAPGARVRSVKRWAVHELHLDHKDAAEHVLQLCGSTERPPSDTPLHVLLRNGCRLCFDLVPEKRVEGRP